MTFLAVLAAQAIAAPIGACAQEHEGADGARHEMTLAGPSHEADGAMDAQADHSAHPDNAPAQAPTDCIALSTCGTSAVECRIGGSHPIPLSVSEDEARRKFAEPVAIVLGLITPPPKI